VLTKAEEDPDAALGDDRPLKEAAKMEKAKAQEATFAKLVERKEMAVSMEQVKQVSGR
jgi:hypothetical protein